MKGLLSCPYPGTRNNYLFGPPSNCKGLSVYGKISRKPLKKIFVVFCVLGILLNLVLTSLWGETSNDSPQLEPVIVTASRIPTIGKDLPLGCQVITREYIEKHNPSNLVDLMRQIPGIHIVQEGGGRGGPASVYLRGGDPNFTLVMIDGIRVNDPTNPRGGSFDFSILPLDLIDRIEVIPAPLSAIYGSDALSGVINIFTKSGAHFPRHSVVTSLGSKKFYTISANTSGRSSTWVIYSITACREDDGMTVEGNEFKGNTLAPKFDITIDELTDLSLMGWFHKSKKNTFPDDSGGPKYSVIRQTEEFNIDEYSLGFQLISTPTDSFELRVKGGYHDKHEKRNSPGVAPGIRDPLGIPANVSMNEYHTYSIEINAAASPNRKVDTNFGMSVLEEKGLCYSSMDSPSIIRAGKFNLNRSLYSIFGELKFKARSGLALFAGARIDFPENFGTKVNPPLESTIDLIPQTQLSEQHGARATSFPVFLLWVILLLVIRV